MYIKILKTLAKKEDFEFDVSKIVYPTPEMSIYG
jgi:hypothetical protein